MGGSLDGAGNPTDGYTFRGGRMLTTDNYECTWGLFKSIPSLTNPSKSVFDETMEFNEHYITSMFMPRDRQDRPLPVPTNSKNLAFVSKFVEIPEDVVFTVEYSVRVAQMAVYELLGINKQVPPILHHDKSIKVNFDAVVKAFR